jgi:hypothetical protein
MRKFKILAVLLFLVTVSVHCETEEIDEIEIETIEEEEPQEPDVVQFGGEDGPPADEEVMGKEEAEEKRDPLSTDVEEEVEVVPYKYKQRDQMFTRQESHNCILNEDFDVFVKHLEETDFSTFVYVRDDNPKEPYNE